MCFVPFHPGNAFPLFPLTVARRQTKFPTRAPQLPDSSFACPTQSIASPGMPCCPRKRLSWAACSCTWRRVYNWSSKKLIGFHHLQGKATWRCACSSDNESSVVWHFWRSCPRRSEEHTSELQSRVDLVCRLLLE